MCSILFVVPNTGHRKQNVTLASLLWCNEDKSYYGEQNVDILLHVIS